MPRPKQEPIRSQRVATLIAWLRAQLIDKGDAAVASYLNQCIQPQEYNFTQATIRRWSVGEQTPSRTGKIYLATAIGCSEVDLEKYLSGKVGEEFLEQIHHIKKELVIEQEGKILNNESRIWVDTGDESSIVNAVMQLLQMVSPSRIAFISSWINELLSQADISPNQAESLAEIVKSYDLINLSISSGIPIERLEKITKGEKPLLPDLSRLETPLGRPLEELYFIY